jgi:subtilisin family serine protease
MQRRVFVWLMIFVLALAGFTPAVAQEGTEVYPLTPAPTAENGQMLQDATHLWFVELASPPTAEGTSLLKVKKEKADFRAEAARLGLAYRERFAFDRLWNGISIEIDPAYLGKLSNMRGVKAIYPVEVISIPPVTAAEDPELATAIAMTGADIVQSEMGYTGRGVKVAIMDTGVDFDHPDLGGCFGPGCRVVTGYDFVGDAFNADPSSTAYSPVPVPDPIPDDCNGHGTHVAGIVGANGVVRGVAPEVTFGAYRVFGCQGSTTADIMIAAMERALDDGMQVLNMSIGSAYQWPQYPTAQASDRLVTKGMVVVASIGNNGANGTFSAGSPGLGKKVIGVASFDNTHVSLAKFTISPDDYGIGYGNAAGAPPAPLSGSLPMTRTGTPTTTNDGCNPLPPGSLTGYAVLIRRGTCTFYTKAYNAMTAGAAAVVLYNNVAGRFSPTVAGSPPITIPVVAISDTEGVLINNRLEAGPVTLTWTDQALIGLNPTGGLISSFSSFGLSPDLELKPDIGAPGGLIRSTYPLEAGAYATISGTSMSSPHVAGAAALLLQAKPRTPAHMVRAILQNSAEPKNWWGNPGLGYLDNVHRQGAGMLQIDDAIRATTIIEPSKLALGESELGPSTQKLTLSNPTSNPITYRLSHTPALATRGTFTVSYFASFADVAFSAETVTVPPFSKATVDVTIAAPDLTGGQYGGYIVFTPEGGGQTLRVPYAGFVGDYQAIQALAPTSFNFPWLSKLTACSLLRGLDCYVGGSYANQPAGATFTMVGTDVPYILVHLDHQVRQLRMKVFDANTGRAWHDALNEQYHPRSSGSTTFFAYPWDGTTTGGRFTYTVPDGQYVIVIQVLKALGDPNNPAHW